MKVSLDGGETYQDAPNGVRVIYEEVDIPGEDVPNGELHINLTNEGIITDVWAFRWESPDDKEPQDYNIGTQSEMLDDLILRLVEENS